MSNKLNSDVFFAIINLATITVEDGVSMTDALIDACYLKEVDFSEFINTFVEAKETNNISLDFLALFEKDALKNGQIKGNKGVEVNEF